MLIPIGTRANELFQKDALTYMSYPEKEVYLCFLPEISGQDENMLINSANNFLILIYPMGEEFSERISISKGILERLQRRHSKLIMYDDDMKKFPHYSFTKLMDMREHIIYLLHWAFVQKSDLFLGKDAIGASYSKIKYDPVTTIENDKEFIDVGDSIMNLRQVKTDKEINKIREAAKIVSEVAEVIPDKLKEGMKENELAALVNYEMMKRGASSPSFDTIAAFGPDTAEPHFTGGSRKLKKGDVVLIDFGAKYERYCSDMTRTFFFGKPDKEMIDVYNTVLEAQIAGIKAISEGKNGKEVDREARKIIDSSRFNGRFIHSLGHGVGLNVHDHPALSPSYDFFLKENMVVTVEPGIYLTGKGGVRIEDDVVVKKDGCEVLTTAPKDLQII